MAKNVRIPTPLRKLTNNEELVEVNAANIGDAIAELQARFPGIAERARACGRVPVDRSPDKRPVSCRGKPVAGVNRCTPLSARDAT